MKQGFTLIELVVAIFILSVGILAVLVIFPLGIQVVGFSKTATIGTQLGQEKIEEIISKPYQEISVGETIESSLPPPFSAFRRETKIIYVDPALDFQEIAVDKGIKKIEVVVSWKSPLKVVEKNIKIETLISKR